MTASRRGGRVMANKRPAIERAHLKEFQDRANQLFLKVKWTPKVDAFSGAGERVRPGPSRRSKEISMVTTKALLPVLDLSECPNAVVDVFVELIETDAGSRCAGICAASMALADAGIPMIFLHSTLVIFVAGRLLLYFEERGEKKESEKKPHTATTTTTKKNALYACSTQQY